MKNTKTNSEIKKMMESNNLYHVLTSITSPRDINTNNYKNKSNRKGILTMKSLRNSIAIVLLAASYIFTGSAFAQDDLNKVFAQMDAKSFQPLTDAFSSSVNSGLYHSAKIKKTFSLYVGIKGATTEVIEAPSSLKIKSIPFAVPQITVGAFGTDVTVRYVPSVGLGKYGSVSTFGISIRHSLSQYINKAPFDATVQFAYQTLNVNDSKDNSLVHTGSIAANIQFSKELSVFTIYTGLQYEKTGADFNFNYSGYNVNYHTENQNRIRGTFGLNIKLGPVNLNGDYSVGKNSSISTGFGLAF